jgi:hypothetical protein
VTTSEKAGIKRVLLELKDVDLAVDHITDALKHEKDNIRREIEILMGLKKDSKILWEMPTEEIEEACKFLRVLDLWRTLTSPFLTTVNRKKILGRVQEHIQNRFHKLYSHVVLEHEILKFKPDESLKSLENLDLSQKVANLEKTLKDFEGRLLEVERNQPALFTLDLEDQ